MSHLDRSPRRRSATALDEFAARRRSATASTIEGRPYDRKVSMATVEAATEIRPFQFDVQEKALEDLRRRIEATRLPSKELVANRSQGVQLALIQELASYWVSEYDWGESTRG